MDVKNILGGIPAELGDELVEVMAEGEGMRVERIVSRGHRSAEGSWYDQDQAEWVMVVKGKARLEFEAGPTVEMGPGDHVTIPAHSRHRVEWTDPDEDTVWLAVHYDAKATD